MDFKTIMPLVKFHGLYESYMSQALEFFSTMKFKYDISVEGDISCFEDFDMIITSTYPVKNKGLMS